MPAKIKLDSDVPKPKKIDPVDQLWHHYSFARAMDSNYYSIRYRKYDGSVEELPTGILVDDGTLKIESVVEKD